MGKVGNIICGDFIVLSIKVKKDKNKEIIQDIKFETYGCLAAIATSVVVCEMAKGKTIEEVLKITQQQVADFLGGLPPVKIHCSLLAVDALREAIYDHLKKNNRKIDKELEKTHQRILKEQKLIEEKFKQSLDDDKKETTK